jgi:hypothetical protein
MAVVLPDRETPRTAIRARPNVANGPSLLLALGAGSVPLQASLPLVATKKSATAGVCSAVNDAPALGTPFTVTITSPVVAPAGTATIIDVALQLVDVAAVPLNVTVLALWVAPKFAPVMVTGAPTAAEAGDRLVMLGGGGTMLGLPVEMPPPHAHRHNSKTTTMPPNAKRPSRFSATRMRGNRSKQPELHESRAVRR